MAEDNRANGHLRLFKSMEHLNYACRVEDFFFCKVSFALVILRMRIAFAHCGSSGGVALPTFSILGSMVCLEHYRMSNVGHIVYSFKRGSTSPSVWPMMVASQAGGNDW